MIFRLLWLTIWLIGCCFGYKAMPQSGTVAITFEPMFSGKSLILNQQQYQLTNGDSLSVDVLRFYVSSVQLQGKGNVNFIEANSYHLMDAEKMESFTFSLKNVPIGEYDSLSFMLGTDSLTNVSGAMSGDLDPTLGMYWAWNSGYINIKMEGRSNACRTLHHAYQFHIGGYMPPHQTVRRIVLPLKKLQVQQNAIAHIQVLTKLDQFFNSIRLATTNQVMIPSALASRLASDFMGTFEIE